MQILISFEAFEEAASSLAIFEIKMLIDRRYFLREEEFVGAFVSKISDLQVGDPWDESTQIGPVLNKRQFNRIMTYIEDSQVDGAEILCGGKPSAKPKGNHRADSHQEGKSSIQDSSRASIRSRRNSPHL